MKQTIVGLLSFPVWAWALQTSYFVGEIRILTPKGETQGLSLALTKRTMDPAKRVIVEEILHVPPQGEAISLTHISQVTEDHFTIRDVGNRLRGEGTLHGTPWSWEKWETRGTFDGKRRFSSKSHLASGVLLVKREIFEDTGKAAMVFSEEYRSIPQDLYDLLHAKLMRAPAKTPLS